MFGYIRPKKAELLMREFSRFRAVYCGLCKALSDRYGLLPRLALTYDLTFFALLFLSLARDDADLSMESCILNPVQKKPVSRNHPVLDLAADATVLLAGGQLADDVADEGGLKPRAAALAFRRALSRARKRLPDLAAEIDSRLAQLHRAEGASERTDAGRLASLFGEVLAVLFLQAADRIGTDADVRDALVLVGRDLGAWIYLIDAADDYSEDLAKGRFNALSGPDRTAALDAVSETLQTLEASLDRTLALLPYERDGGIMKNIALAGLPDVRRAVFAGQKLTRL
ncbi:MAG TPA: hypothetical protein GXZ64_05155 [Clostridiaceae bacterium]|nr:hypothetical protein [Clostridiaceae bacterium]